MAAGYPNVKYPSPVLNSNFAQNNLFAIILTRNYQKWLQGNLLLFLLNSNQLGLNIIFAQYPGKDSCKPEVLALFKVNNYKNNLSYKISRLVSYFFGLKF